MIEWLKNNPSFPFIDVVIEDGGGSEVGEFAEVRITGSDEHDLTGMVAS